VRTVVERAGIDPVEIDEVVFVGANQAGEDNRNVARMAVLLAGLPDSVPGFTVNRLCASGLTAISTARQMISAGDADVVVAGGVESMTRAPWVTEKPSRPWGKPGASFDTSIGWRFTNPAFGADTTLTMPQTAERVAERWGLTREELDAFAPRSHERALEAQTNGHFDAEVVPVGDFVRDEGPAPTPGSSDSRRCGRSTAPVASSPPATPARSTAEPRPSYSSAKGTPRPTACRARVVAGAHAGSTARRSTRQDEALTANLSSINRPCAARVGVRVSDA